MPGEGMDKALRLFVALPLPENARLELAALKRRLDYPRFTRNPHLTLRFIGNADCADPFAIALGRIRCKPFELRLKRTGLLRRDILWLAPDPCPLLLELKARIDEALAYAGLRPEKRPFWPHLTLARTRTGAAAVLIGELARLKIDICWQAEEFCLYNSVLQPQGALHEKVAGYRLE